jgi:hypothetical protein
MKKIASSSAVALALSLASNTGLAAGVVTGATTMSENAVPTTYTLLPYITVSTSPYIAQQTAYDASDIWSQQSSMNEDLFLLQYKQELEHSLEKVNSSLSQRPILEISGAIEGLAIQSFNSFTSSSSSGNGDINLNTAELDFNAMASRWATAFLTVAYDSSPPETGNRVTNSRLYLSRGFATIGNLDVLPFYFTIGQMYLPFGRYSSSMITAPLTLSLARVNDRAAVLGYSKNGVYASIYAYSGIDSNSSDTVFHEGGINLGYKFKPITDLSVNIGGGAISNMTASQGIGNTGASLPQFPGFVNLPTDLPQSSNTYPFAKTVPGGDVHTEISYGPWYLAAEFLGAFSPFSSEDLTYNGEGADPKAMHVELSRSFAIINQTFTAGVAYGHSWEAVGLNLPQQSFIGYLRTSFWKNTIQQIEFRHDDDYSTDDSSEAAAQTGVPFHNQGTGKTNNMLLAQLGVYF